MASERERDHAEGASVALADAALYRRIGAANLALAGGIDLAAGAALLALARTDRLTRIAFAALEPYLAETALLRQAPAVVTATTTGATLLGAALAAIGIGALLAAWALRRGESGGGSGSEPGTGPGSEAGQRGRRRLWLPAAVCAGLNPLALPPAAVAVALCYLGDRDRSGPGLGPGSG
jgi:hypothetical protein